jgi:hypothetical protein
MTVHRALTGSTLSVLFLGAISCSSSVEPSHSVTLQVMNQTCSPGPCTTLQILAFPSNQPNTPGGFWSLDLGVVTAASACLTIPANATFRVTGPGETTTYTWTSAIPLSLGTLLPTEPRLQAKPSTGTFVPRSASGWSVTLPGASQPTPSGACTP